MNLSRSSLRDAKVLSSPITLTVHLLPEDYRKFKKNQNHKRGIKVPLGLYNFLSTIFELNESQREKITDEEIIAIVRSNYSSKLLFTQEKLARYRGLFNQGKLAVNYFPEHPSFRYNHRGEKLTKVGTKLLPPYAERRIITYHAARKAKHEEWLKSLSRSVWEGREDDYSI